MADEAETDRLIRAHKQQHEAAEASASAGARAARRKKRARPEEGGGMYADTGAGAIVVEEKVEVRMNAVPLFGRNLAGREPVDVYGAKRVRGRCLGCNYGTNTLIGLQIQRIVLTNARSSLATIAALVRQFVDGWMRSKMSAKRRSETLWTVSDILRHLTECTISEGVEAIMGVRAMRKVLGVIGQDLLFSAEDGSTAVGAMNSLAMRTFVTHRPRMAGITVEAMSIVEKELATVEAAIARLAADTATRSGDITTVARDVQIRASTDRARARVEKVKRRRREARERASDEE